MCIHLFSEQSGLEMADFSGIAFDNPNNRCFCNASCNALLSSQIIASNVNPTHCIGCNFLFSKRQTQHGLHSSSVIKEWIASTSRTTFDNGDQQDPGEFIQHWIENCDVLSDLTKSKFYLEFECDCGKVEGKEETRHIWYEEIKDNLFHSIIGERFVSPAEKFCTFCKANKWHKVKENLVIPPRVLIIVLKRFKTSKSGRPIGKITIAIDPPEKIQLNDQLSYTNQAIMVHQGHNIHTGSFHKIFVKSQNIGSREI